MPEIAHARPPTGRAQAHATTPRDKSAHHPRTIAPPTEDYIIIPRRMVIELRDNPLAIGIYAFISRLFLIHQRPIPLSRGDLQLVDPTLKHGAIKRALDRLLASHWLLAEPTTPKRAYTPTWGTRRDTTIVPWQLGSARLGAPSGMLSDRTSCALLDTYVGRLQPHQHAPYFTSYSCDAAGQPSPLLSLSDVGGYCALRAGVASSASDGLRRWGLADEHGARQVPHERAALALLSQRATPDGARLSEAGWQRLGWSAPPAADDSAELLFFVPRARIGESIGRSIGGQIGEQIGRSDEAKTPSSAAACQKVPGERTRATQPRNLRNLRNQTESPPQQEEVSVDIKVSADALLAIGVFPKVAKTFADLPPALIAATIAHAQATSTITHKAGWVVAALRQHRVTGWLPSNTPAAAPIDFAAELAELHAKAAYPSATPIANREALEQTASTRQPREPDQHRTPQLSPPPQHDIIDLADDDAQCSSADDSVVPSAIDECAALRTMLSSYLPVSVCQLLNYVPIQTDADTVRLLPRDRRLWGVLWDWRGALEDALLDAGDTRRLVLEQVIGRTSSRQRRIDSRMSTPLTALGHW